MPKVQLPGIPAAQPQAIRLDESFLRDGGAERDRTVDPLLAKQVLSQLSYSPIATELLQLRD